MFLELGIVVFGRRGFLEDKNGMSRCIMSMTSVIDNPLKEREMDSH